MEKKIVNICDPSGKYCLKPEGKLIATVPINGDAKALNQACLCAWNTLAGLHEKGLGECLIEFGSYSERIPLPVGYQPLKDAVIRVAVENHAK